MREVVKVDVGSMSNAELDSEFQKHGITTSFAKKSKRSNIMWASFVIIVGLLSYSIIFIN